MKVILGTVASAYANNNFDPCLIIPPYSWSVPGKNPGTSTNVIIGILNALANLTNLAAFTDALISKHPAFSSGSFAIIATVLPSNLAKQVIIFFANS